MWLCHTSARGVWGHAPPGKFWNVQFLRLLLAASESTCVRLRHKSRYFIHNNRQQKFMNRIYIHALETQNSLVDEDWMAPRSWSAAAASIVKVALRPTKPAPSTVWPLHSWHARPHPLAMRPSRRTCWAERKFSNIRVRLALVLADKFDWSSTVSIVKFNCLLNGWQKVLGPKPDLPDRLLRAWYWYWNSPMTNTIYNLSNYTQLAHCCRNEEEVGSALKKCGIPREEIYVTTKVNAWLL